MALSSQRYQQSYLRFEQECLRFWASFAQSHSGFKSIRVLALVEALEALRTEPGVRSGESESTYGCVKEEQGSAVQFAEIIVESIRKYVEERKSSITSIAICATFSDSLGRLQHWQIELCLLYEQHKLHYLLGRDRARAAAAEEAEELLLLINRPFYDESSTMPAFIFSLCFFCFCNLNLFPVSFLYLLLYHIEGKES